MKKAERLLASRLLQEAANTYANHVCNDMPFEMFDDITAEEIETMGEAFNKWNCPSGEDIIPWKQIGDSSWMEYLAHRLTCETS